MKSRLIQVTLLVSVVIFMLSACQSDEEFQKNPVDDLIRDMNQESIYSIILYDMDVEGNFSKTYKHQYQVITEKDSVPQNVITEWYTVSRSFFQKNVENMGMEIAAKDRDGVVTKSASPPGFSNYVGNTSYGQWQTGSDGNSFWEFYGKYAMISTMFNLMSTPIYRSQYGDWRGNYYGRTPYYGGNTRVFGTASPHQTQFRNTSAWNSKPNNQSFRNRVRERVNPSSSGGQKTSRSSQRYGSGSSFRSRSRSSGK